MQAPTDNIIKSSAIPEPVIKLKSTRKETGSDLSKTEFDKELQDKFKSTIKGIDDFEHKAQTVMFEHDSLVDDKIRYDKTISEKSLHDYEDPIAKDYQTEKAERSKDITDYKSSVTHTTEEVTVNNVKESIVRQKDSTITTVRFLEQETQDQLHERFAKQTEDLIDPELATKLTAQKDKITDFIQTERELNIPPKMDKSEDVIDPELAAKLTVQKDKIIDFVEPTIDILSPVKCEMKKTISSDCIDSELSAKLSKQKEKAERIVEDEVPTTVLASPVHHVPSTDFGKDFDDQFQKDFHTEKTTKTTTSTFLQKEADNTVNKVTQSKTSAIETKTTEIVEHGKITSEAESITKIVSDTIRGAEETITSKITDVKTEIQKLNGEQKPSVTQSTVSFLESETKTIVKDHKNEPKTSEVHVSFLESEMKPAEEEHIPHLGNIATTVITDVKTEVHSRAAEKPATQTTVTTTKITEQDDQLDDSLERHTSSTTTTTVTEVKSLESENKPTNIQSTISFLDSEAKTVLGDEFKQLSSDASSLESDIYSLTGSVVPEVKSTISFMATETRSVIKDASSTISDSVKAAEAKSSTGPFVNETDSDEFYKTIEAKITKKLSQDYSAMQQDISSAGKYGINFLY